MRSFVVLWLLLLAPVSLEDATDFMQVSFIEGHPENGTKNASLRRNQSQELTRPIPLGVTPQGTSVDDRERFRFEIHVIACKRPLNRLLQQISQATCLSDRRQELFIHIDACEGDYHSIREAADLYMWPCGKKTVIQQEKNLGLRKMWFSIFDLVHSRHEEHGKAAVLVLEDDIAISKVYALHLESMFAAIRNFPVLVGASLSPIRFEEQGADPRRWHGNVELGSDTRVFISEVPSSWGGAYWSSMAGPFMKYVRERMKFHSFEVEACLKNWDDSTGKPNCGTQEPSELSIPFSCSGWYSSWKRHLIEFMYVNGLGMAYPNLPNESGYATSLCLAGEHYEEGGGTDVRVAPVVDELLPFPSDVNGWPVLDLQLRPSSKAALLAEGRSFLAKVPQEYTVLKEAWELHEELS
jgi:hypothetical protein